MRWRRKLRKSKKRNATNKGPETHRPLLAMLTAYLWHFGPNTLSSRIVSVSVRSNQFPEELVDPQVFQIRSLAVAFGPMWLGPLKPGRNDGMPRARNNKTWCQLSGTKAVAGESAKTSTPPQHPPKYGWKVVASSNLINIIIQKISHPA